LPQQQFTFYNQLVVRIPALPFVQQKNDDLLYPHDAYNQSTASNIKPTDATLEQVNDDAIKNTWLLQHVIHNKYIEEAIFLASPVLYTALQKYKMGILVHKKEVEKLCNALYKYYTRMYSRSTPFGLCSGCAVAQWANADDIKISNPYRHTRLDMHYLCALTMVLAKVDVIKQRLTYYTNTSCYTIANEIRYAEYTYKEANRQYQLSAIEPTDYIHTIIQQCQQGVPYIDIVQILVNTYKVSEPEAHDFVH
jgi:lantibiotic biosynthesis protein